MQEPTQPVAGEGCQRRRKHERYSRQRSCRGIGDGMQARGDFTQHGKPQTAVAGGDQPDAREGRSRAVWGDGEARSTAGKAQPSREAG